jgi:hypothetical protein
MPRIDGLALAGDGDIFVTAGMAAVVAGLGNRTGYFIGVDTPIGGSLREIPRLAVGLGGVGAAFLAPGEALIDAVTIRLIGNDEDATVGPRCRPSQNGQAGQKR